MPHKKPIILAGATVIVLVAAAWTADRLVSGNGASEYTNDAYHYSCSLFCSLIVHGFRAFQKARISDGLHREKPQILHLSRPETKLQL
ncbi:hypothetical protein [Komagataeibacter europaeus]|nr:hypothetical protein [Komagataeibacter europaeus]